jgi:hypothetical protein
MMAQKIFIDSNVPKTSNRTDTPQAGLDCVSACVELIKNLVDDKKASVLVIDDGWRILNEYKGQLRSSGQRDVGGAFLKWALTNWANPERCERVTITPTEGERGFYEFPDAPGLAGFDPSDRKFVAVALAHPEHPPIANATDSDWWHYRRPLAECGVTVDFLCPELMTEAVGRR